MQQIDYQINNKIRIYIHKTPLCLLLNARAFDSKRQRVLLKTYLRFVQNSLAFHLKRKSVSESSSRVREMVAFAHS